jgi:Leucine-rich repeat (LRR) protein
MSQSEQVKRIENIDRYTQQYVDGALVLTLREEYVEELRLIDKGLAELPPLPPNLKILVCDRNNLTSLNSGRIPTPIARHLKTH